MTKGASIFLGIIILFAGAYYFIYPALQVIKKNDPMPAMSPKEMMNATQGKIAQVEGTFGHPSSGEVRLLKSGDKTIIRFENLKTVNGPELHLYLSKDLKANEYFDLGEITGTEGNINYEIPQGINAEEYRYVLTWCEPFRVLFNYVDLDNIRKN